MSYMIEGGGSTTQSKAKRWLYRHPEASHMLLRMLTDVVVEYLLGQVAAGAQVRTQTSTHLPATGPTGSLPHREKRQQACRLFGSLRFAMHLQVSVPGNRAGRPPFLSLHSENI